MAGGLPKAVPDRRNKEVYWFQKTIAQKTFRYGTYIWVSVIGFIIFVALYEPTVIKNVFYSVHDSGYKAFGYDTKALGVHEQHIERYMRDFSRKVQVNRDKFLLWDYFDLSPFLEKKKQTEYKWQDMIASRMQMMVGKLNDHGDKRYLVEKDKCVTMDLLDKLNLPHPALQFKAKIAEYEPAKLKSFLASAKYPSILKVGHIHQQRSTLFLSSEEDVKSRLDEYVDWTTDLMHQKFVDNNPAWKDATNVLYAAIDACMFVQDVINPDGFSVGHTERPLELMVEVLWGVPTHAVLTTTVRGELKLGKAQYKNTEEYMILENGWVSYHWPKTRWSGNPLFNDQSAVMAHRMNGGISWFRGVDPSTATLEQKQEVCLNQEDHDRDSCLEEHDGIQQKFWNKYGPMMKHVSNVWKVCGALGTGIGADYVRCDVFVTPSGAISVNEISLSSNWGNALSPAWQERFIKAWVDGYKEKDTNCTKGKRCGSGFGGVFGDGVKGKADQFADIPSPVYSTK